MPSCAGVANYSMNEHAPAQVLAVAFSPSGIRVLSGADDGSLKSWIVSKGLSVHSASVWEIVWAIVWAIV